MSEVENNTQSEQMLQRDENGLVVGVNYKFKKNGYRKVIDWRAMILPEHLVFNKQYQKEIEERIGKPFDHISIEEALASDKLEDRHFLILLAGIKELAALRGFVSVDTSLDKVEQHHCAARCHITWMPNFETSGHTVTFGDGAGASLDNTNGFGQIFLETIAINRAFVRAVRNFLGISIVGQDEIGGKFKKESGQPSQTVAFSSNSYLEQVCSERKISFETFQKRVIQGYKHLLKDQNPEAWKSFADLKPLDATNLLELIKKD